MSEMVNVQCWKCGIPRGDGTRPNPATEAGERL